MHLRRSLTALSLVLAVAYPAAAAPLKKAVGATAARKNQAIRVVKGTVVAVEHNQGKGSITVKVHHTKPSRASKKSITARAAAAPKKKANANHTVKFAVGKNTLFTRVTVPNNTNVKAKGKGRPKQAATFAAVKAGDHVHLHVTALHPHHAREVHIVMHTGKAIAAKPAVKKK